MDYATDNGQIYIKLLSSVFLVVTSGLLIEAIWSLFLSPLSKVPGPKFAKISSIPMLIAQSKSKRMYWVQSLFEDYGPIVQIAPNVVATNETEGIRKIYKNMKVFKGPFYETFSIIDGSRPCLALRDVKQANQRRKSYLPAFSRQNLMAFAPRIYEHLQEFIDKLDEVERQGEALDAFCYWRYLTLDVVVDLTFNGKLNLLKHPGEGARFVDLTADQAKWFFLNIYFPFMGKFPEPLLPAKLLKWKQGAADGEKFPKEALKNWREQRKAANVESRSLDVIETLSKFGEGTPNEKLTDGDIVTSISEIMTAGSDTTATIAACVCFELANNPQIQAKLYQELCQIIPGSVGTTFSPEMFSALEVSPYLNAVCKEGMRKYASLPALLERVVPPEGMEINGTYLPGGTTIAMQAYSQHRKEDVYPGAERFFPERWLDETTEMKENFLTFSAGNRACVGLNLAHLQLRLYLGTVLREFELRLHPSTTESSMKMLESYIITPQEKCLIHFTRRGAQGSETPANQVD
ncbi:hypothetical protein NM208_g2344 [Fusarium decemcellulare]|uniref:Uncharacterized protein n=2 Tax=Fusarium decemcellulare TaxID=57161 RepID=A0ACC1ST17_9HYPO|nr:hypothetical protein NM208_g4294 [Fusarium decemcellulare]KAJ3545761.1 hypothetical protein NM208_g2344 [Fusarium decemcellulare]